MGQRLRWELGADGVQHGYIVDSTERDSTGPCPVCHRRHRANLIEGTNMNETCFDLYTRLRERAQRGR